MSHDDDIDKELRFHIDERTDELIASGMAPDEARRQARLELGGVMQTKEAVRDLGLWSIVNGLVQDLRARVPHAARHAGRHLRRGALARARHRRQHRDVLAGQQPAAARAAGARSGAPGPAQEPRARGISGMELSRLERDPPAAAAVRRRPRRGRPPRAPTSPWPATTHHSGRLSRQRIVLRHARRDRAGRAHILGSRRSARRRTRRPGRGDQPRLLAAALRRRRDARSAAPSPSRTCRSRSSA